MDVATFSSPGHRLECQGRWWGQSPAPTAFLPQVRPVRWIPGLREGPVITAESRRGPSPGLQSPGWLASRQKDQLLTLSWVSPRLLPSLASW